jgi:2-dehydro-3-deoxygluconokinase
MIMTDGRGDTPRPALDVVTFGEALGLFLAAEGKPVGAARQFERQVAGAEINVAVALARLGHDVGWFGRVGADSSGAQVLATLRAEGVDASRAIVDEERPTGLLVRDAHPERRLQVDYHRAFSAGSRLCAGDLDAAYIQNARALHVTGITAALSATAIEAVRTALEIARGAGVQTVLDPNVRLKLWSPDAAGAALADLAPLADVILTGADEAALVTGYEGEAAAEWFLDRGASVVVVKDGAAGAWATDGAAIERVAARPVTAVDPVGAGDAFDAGFLSARLRGRDLRGCLSLGAVMGAACVQVRGDLDGLPSRAEVEALMNDVTEVNR